MLKRGLQEAKAKGLGPHPVCLGASGGRAEEGERTGERCRGHREPAMSSPFLTGVILPTTVQKGGGWISIIKRRPGLINILNLLKVTQVKSRSALSASYSKTCVLSLRSE